MHCNYRNANQDDYSIIFEIQKNYSLKYEDPTIVNIKEILERIEMNLNSNIETYTCVLLDDEVVGYYRMEEDYDFFYDLSFFYIKKEYRRNGIGTLVIHRIKQQCDEALQANVLMKDHLICSFLEKNDFQIKRIVSKSRMIMECK